MRTAIQKVRKPEARISAKRLARLGGKLPFSTIAPKKEKPCTSTSVHSANVHGNAERRKIQSVSFRQSSSVSRAGKKQSRTNKRFIAPRKKRTSTPILSTPYPGALDPRSHYTADRRLKLYGKDKEAMREKIFLRAGGRCEERVRLGYGVENMPAKKVPFVKCTRHATEWSHNRHGSNKCDCLKCGKASCAQCHHRKHNSGKETPCPSPKS